jgi:hypothetical protein
VLGHTDYVAASTTAWTFPGDAPEK